MEPRINDTRDDKREQDKSVMEIAAEIEAPADVEQGISEAMKEAEANS